MRAVTVNEFGGPEVLVVEDVEKPTLKPSDVLVAVRAVGVNPVDAGVRSGGYPILGQPPFVVGWDIAGVVEEADPGLPWKRGDEVFGMPFFPRTANGYSEYVLTPARQLVRKPASLTFVEAAALPLAGLTAWQALVDMAGVLPGQRVLVHGAGGGVGHLAVQIAKARGAYVVATASGSKRRFVESLGADEFIDYTAGNFEDATGDIDVVLELVGKGYADRSLAVLKPGGILVTAVERWDTDLADRYGAAGRRFAGVSVEPDQIGLLALVALVEAGTLRPHVSEVFALEDAAKAHALMWTGVTGKIVLEV